jgi:hypothetical protein
LGYQQLMAGVPPWLPRTYSPVFDHDTHLELPVAMFLLWRHISGAISTISWSRVLLEQDQVFPGCAVNRIYPRGFVDPDCLLEELDDFGLLSARPADRKEVQAVNDRDGLLQARPAACDPSGF